MRFYILLILSVVSLFARDNPFFPADPNEVEVTTSNRVETLAPFSKQTISLPNSARAIKAVTITYQNLDGSISNETMALNNKIDWHEPFILSQKSTRVSSKAKMQKSRSIKTKYITFTPEGKKMRLVTKDKLLRNFMLTNPHRIVMDFAKNTSFRPKSFKVNQAPFTKIRMGNHNKYYRVVIELDGQYNYKLQSSEKDLSVVCY